MSISIPLPSTFPSPKLSSNSIPFPFRKPTINPIQRYNFSNPKNKLGFFSFGRKNLEFIVVKSSSAGNGEGEGEGGGESKSSSSSMDARGESTMPERFRYLTKEASESPVRWPIYIALAFLMYAWRTVLWELYNWKKATISILHFFGYLSKLVLAFIFHFIGDPLTATIRGIETTLYALRAFYSKVVAYAPIPELTTIILLASAVLAIGEVASPNSVDNQWHTLTIAGLLGYFAVTGTIGDLFFWTILFGLFYFSHFMKKSDYVSSTMPVAAVLAGVGEPWVRVVVIGSYLALAIVQYSKQSPEEAGDAEDSHTTTGARRVPVPLLWAGLAIGVRVAARWAGYRHLTWMVV